MAVKATVEEKVYWGLPSLRVGLCDHHGGEQAGKYSNQVLTN